MTDTTPVRLVVAFGMHPCRAISDGTPLEPDDGDISIVEFATTAEAEAYARGISDAEGWMEAMVVEVSSEPEGERPFFDSGATDYIAWHNSTIDDDG